LWGCGFEDFVGQSYDDGNIVDLYMKCRGRKETALNRAYFAALRDAPVNPTIDRATSVSDFDFSSFRRKPQTVYLVVSPDNIRPLAPLIRLFFSDLIASLQDHEPGEDEPWPVMIMLDEFDRLGKMPIVAESIKTLRSYGGHLAIITQTIPALDEIYGENTRLSLQGGAGVMRSKISRAEALRTSSA